MSPARLFPILICLGLGLTGCATVFQGSRQKVFVVTEPTAASLEVDGVRIGQTPATIRVKRGKTHSVRVSKSGFEDRTVTMNSSVNGGWVFLDILCGLVPLVVDIANSNWESFEHSLYMTMQPLAPPLAPGAATPVISPLEPAPAAQTGEFVLRDGGSVAMPGGSGTIFGKIKRGWHRREVDLTFDGSLTAGDDPTGPFTRGRLTTGEGHTTFLRTSRGDVVRLTITRIETGSVTFEWTRL